MRSHESDLLTGRPEGSPRRSRWIAGALVFAVLLASGVVWTSRRSAGGAGGADGESASLPTKGSGEVAGFRSDAWYLPDDELLGFVEIPAGPFIMGGDSATLGQAFDIEWSSGRDSRGTVDVPTFFISRYEVTVAQFRAFVEATGFGVDNRALRAPPDHPARAVSWTDALAYCRWLQEELEGSPETPPVLRRLLEEGWRVTLPSEAEWEKAARGPDGSVYPWGDEPRADRANFATAGPTAVASFECPECAYPLFDMSGNVWEWTRGPYQPGDLEADALWVIRGGSYQDLARDVLPETRGAGAPGVRRPFIGFRLAISRF